MIRKIFADGKVPYDRPHDRSRLHSVLPVESGATTAPQVLTNNLRFNRRVFTFSTTAFIVGAVLILMQSPLRNEFLAPGAVNSHHAQILAGQGADRCASCHEAGKQDFSGWLASAFSIGRNVQACQSDLCMKCHNNSISQPFATKPHNLDPSELGKINDKYQPVSFSIGFKPPVDHKGEIECSACHREHHGAADLTKMTDQQCQTCHSQKYHSFSDGHPEFSKWPQQRRQRIAFDHVSHGFKHFPSQNERFDCKTCHVDDDFQTVKLLASYQQTCAKCHQQDIEGRSEPGMQLVILPMLDLDAVNAQALSVGQWPENASGDFDGAIPELMQLMLFMDDDARPILEKRGPAFSFADFDPDNPDDIRDAVVLAWATKYLVYDLVSNGVNEIRKRVEFALNRSISEHEFRKLTDGLDRNAFVQAANKWLPGLVDEVPRRRGKGVADLINAQPLLRYFRQDEPEQLVENPIASLITNNRSDSVGISDIVVKTGEQEMNPAKNPNPQYPIGSPARTIPESELLANNPLLEMGVLSNSMAGQHPSVPGNVGRIGSANESALTIEFAERVSKVNRPQGAGVASEFNASNGETYVGTQKLNGWFRNDSTFQISYRPTGHADDFLTTVFEITTQTKDVQDNPATAALFNKLTSSTSVGACNDCHTIDKQNDSTFKINWQPKYRDPLLRSFTKFSHGPHITQPHMKDCTSCHWLDESLTNAHTFDHFDSCETVSNFTAITKSNCSSCHFEGGTNNGCTQCHNYHVGSRILISQ